jgi:hypothetical protein
MSKFICQKEMVCSCCGDEIPKGAWAYEDMWEDIYCEGCEEINRDGEPTNYDLKH